MEYIKSIINSIEKVFDVSEEIFKLVIYIISFLQKNKVRNI